MQCWAYKSKKRASIKKIINTLQCNPILLQPCLDLPLSPSHPPDSPHSLLHRPESPLSPTNAADSPIQLSSLSTYPERLYSTPTTNTATSYDHQPPSTTITATASNTEAFRPPPQQPHPSEASKVLSAVDLSSGGGTGALEMGVHGERRFLLAFKQRAKKSFFNQARWLFVSSFLSKLCSFL